MISFFEDEPGWAFKPEALEFSHECNELLKPVFEEWVAKGYSPREICHLIADSASYQASLICLNKRLKKPPKETGNDLD